MSSNGLGHPSGGATEWERLENLWNSQWQDKVVKSLEYHFGSLAFSRHPIYTTGAILFSDPLIKDTQTLIEWMQMTRDALAIEMEAAGIYRAARSGETEIPFSDTRHQPHGRP